MNERTVQHFYENGWRKLTVVHISEVKEELNKKDCQISKLERKIQELELALSNSREHEKALRKCFDNHRQRIKELEAKNSADYTEYQRKTQEQAKRIAELETHEKEMVKILNSRLAKIRIQEGRIAELEAELAMDKKKAENHGKRLQQKVRKGQGT